MKSGKKLLIILISLSLIIGIVWVLIPSGRTKQTNTMPPNIYHSLENIIKNTQNISQTFQNNKEFINNLKATSPMYIWARQYAEETEKLLQSTPQWKTIGKIDEKEAGQIMGNASSTLEDRLFAMSMGYLSMFNKLLASGSGVARTIDMGGASISGIDALVRARAGAYTLVDWKQVMEKTSTKTRVEFIRDKAKDWETSYNDLKKLLLIDTKKPNSTILDIGSTYISIYNLKNITTNTYKNAVDILENKSQDTNLSTMSQSTLMFMLYSSEYARVGIEVLSTLKQMEASITADRDISISQIKQLLSTSWKNIESTLNIKFPADPTSTTGLTQSNKISDQLASSLNFPENSIGYLLINSLMTNYERYYKTMQESNGDLMYAFYLTAQSKGIANFISRETQLAQGILLKAPTSTQTIPQELMSEKLTFDQIYAWELSFIKDTYTHLSKDGNYPLIFDTFGSVAKIGYSAITLTSDLQKILKEYSKVDPLEISKQMVGKYTRFMIDNLYTLFDILTINGALDILGK